MSDLPKPKWWQVVNINKTYVSPAWPPRQVDYFLYTFRILWVIKVFSFKIEIWEQDDE